MRAAFAAMHKVAQQHPCSVFSVIEKLKEHAPSSTHEGLDGIHDRFLQCAEFDFSLVRCQSSPSYIHETPPRKHLLSLPASAPTLAHRPHSAQLKAELWRVAGKTACRRALTSLLYGYTLCAADRALIGGRHTDRLFTALHNNTDLFAHGWGTKAGAVEEVEEESEEEAGAEAEVEELTKEERVEAGRLAARKAARREEREKKEVQEIESKVKTRVREACSLTLSARTRRALGSGGSRSVVGVCIAGSSRVTDMNSMFTLLRPYEDYALDGARFEVAALVRLTSPQGRAEATVTVGAVVVWLSIDEALCGWHMRAARAAVAVGAAAAAAAARAEEARLLRSNRHLHTPYPSPPSCSAASSLTPTSSFNPIPTAHTPTLSSASQLTLSSRAARYSSRRGEQARPRSGTPTNGGATHATAAMRAAAPPPTSDGGSATRHDPLRRVAVGERNRRRARGARGGDWPASWGATRMMTRCCRQCEYWYRQGTK